MLNTTARSVTASARRVLRAAGLLDAVVKVSTREDRGTWVTFVETVTKGQAETLAGTLAKVFPGARTAGGAAFFGVQVIQDAGPGQDAADERSDDERTVVSIPAAELRDGDRYLTEGGRFRTVERVWRSRTGRLFPGSRARVETVDARVEGRSVPVSWYPEDMLTVARRVPAESPLVCEARRDLVSIGFDEDLVAMSVAEVKRFAGMR